MRTLPRALVLSLMVTTLSAQRPAAAEDAPAPSRSPIFAPRTTAAPAPTPIRTGDGALGLEQFGLATLGTVTTLGAGLALTLLTDDGEGRAFGGSFFVAPTVAGLVVCRTGKWSVLYRGRCGAAVAGAYVGALGGMLPGLLLGLATCSDGSSAPDPSNPEAGPSGKSTSDCFTGIAVGALVGYVLGSATGALVGWNISKQPKEPADELPASTDSADASDGERPFAPAASTISSAGPPGLPAERGATVGPRHVIFPIFAAAF